jgi:hypothetical protein
MKKRASADDNERVLEVVDEETERLDCELILVL